MMHAGLASFRREESKVKKNKDTGESKFLKKYSNIIYNYKISIRNTFVCLVLLTTLVRLRTSRC